MSLVPDRGERLRLVMYVASLLVAVGIFAVRPATWASELFALVFLSLVYFRFPAPPRATFALFTLVWAITGSTTTLPLKAYVGRNLHVYYFYLAIWFIWWLVVTLRERPGTRAWRRPINLLPLLFLAYTALSISFAGDRGAAAARVSSYIMFAIFMLIVIAENSDSERLARTLRLLQFMAVGILLLGFVRMFTLIPTEPDNQSSMLKLDLVKLPYFQHVPTVFFYNPNDYAVFVSWLVLGFAVKFAYDRTLRERIFSGAMMLGGLLNLVFAMSRAALISTFVGLVVYLVYLAIRRNFPGALKTGLATLTLGAALVGLYFTPAVAPYFGKLNTTVMMGAAGQPIQVDNSSMERIALLQNVIKGVFIDGHYAGLGAGNTEYYIASQGNTNGIVNAHSFWFEILGDFGLVGLGLYSAFLLVAGVALLRRDRDGKSALDQLPLLWLGAGVLLVFAPSSVVTFTPFWLVNGLAAARVNQKAEVEAAPQPTAQVVT